MSRGPVNEYGCVRWCPAKISKSIYSEEGIGRADGAEPPIEKIYLIPRLYIYSVPAPDIAGINLAPMAFCFPAKRRLLPLWSADGRLHPH